MSRIFDGIAGLQRGILGGPVTIYPGGGPAVVIQAIFRVRLAELETDISADDAAVQEATPVLRASITDVATLVTGDRVDAPNGKSYRCLPRQIEASPAVDANVTIPLELIGI